MVPRVPYSHTPRYVPTGEEEGGLRPSDDSYDVMTITMSSLPPLSRPAGRYPAMGGQRVGGPSTVSSF
jgi:hypothetical protein